MAGRQLTSDEFVAFAGAVMIANSVKDIDAEPPLPMPSSDSDA